MTTSPGRVPPRFGVLRAIALYKLVKVLLLLATAYEVLKLRDASTIAHLYTWMATLPTGLERNAISYVLAWFSGLTAARVETLGIVTLVYATIFAVEGVGLWMRKLWAEWLTILVTGSLIPLELWELGHRPTLAKAAVLLANGAIVWYLIIQVRRSHQAALESADPNVK